jgi:ATP-dependent RNA helicase RhlE
LSSTFATLGLSTAITRAGTEQGYTTPTPIQERAIPVILAGRDVLAGARTGTGKTAGFALPLLQRLAVNANTSASPAKHPVRAPVLTPTRELAAQVEQCARTYGRHTGLRSTVIYGGMRVKPQIDALRRGVDIPALDAASGDRHDNAMPARRPPHPAAARGPRPGRSKGKAVHAALLAHR